MAVAVAASSFQTTNGLCWFRAAHPRNPPAGLETFLASLLAAVPVGLPLIAWAVPASRLPKSLPDRVFSPPFWVSPNWGRAAAVRVSRWLAKRVLARAAMFLVKSLTSRSKRVLTAPSSFAGPLLHFPTRA